MEVEVEGRSGGGGGGGGGGGEVEVEVEVDIVALRCGQFPCQFPRQTSHTGEGYNGSACFFASWHWRDWWWQKWRLLEVEGIWERLCERLFCRTVY